MRSAETLWINSEQQINVQKFFRVSVKWFFSGKLYMSVGQCHFFYRRSTVDYNWIQDIHIQQWIIDILLEGNPWKIHDRDSMDNEWANLEFISPDFLVSVKKRCPVNAYIFNYCFFPLKVKGNMVIVLTFWNGFHLIFCSLVGIICPVLKRYPII